jgi:hypothetical protein
MNPKRDSTKVEHPKTTIAVVLLVVWVIFNETTAPSSVDPEFEKTKADRQKILCGAHSVDAAMARHNGEQKALDATTIQLADDRCIR